MRSPARRTGSLPAAIASSTVWGVSITGTAIPASAASTDAPSARDAAADRDRGLARGMRPLGDPQRGLPEGRLLVDPALAGDDDIRSRELRVEAGRLHHQVDPRPECEACEAVLDRQQPEADATGRAGARRVALATARPRLQLVGPVGVHRIEEGHERGRGALLRSVDRRRALRSEERVRHVARDVEGPQPRASREINMQVRLSCAQRMEEPPSAIGRGAAADAQHDSVSPRVERRAEQIAGPDAARGDRVTLARGSTSDRPDASAISTTADAPSSDRSHAAGSRRPSGSRTVGLAPAPAAGRIDRGERALAAVGERREEAARRPGRAVRQPSASARATSTEVSEPLNESGANRTVAAASAEAPP